MNEIFLEILNIFNGATYTLSDIYHLTTQIFLIIHINIIGTLEEYQHDHDFNMNIMAMKLK